MAEVAKSAFSGDSPLSVPQGEDEPRGRPARSFRRRLVFAGAVLGLSCLAALVILEVACRFWIFAGQAKLFRDPDHRRKPHEWPEINSDGLRCRSEADQFRAGDLNVIFLGDSVVNGYRLPYEFSIPYVFEKKAQSLHPDKRVHVANFAWASSCPFLSYRLLKDVGRKYKPRAVIIGVDMSDFQEDIAYRVMVSRQGICMLSDFLSGTVAALDKLTAHMDRVRTGRGLGKIHMRLFGFPPDRQFIEVAPLSETLPYTTAIKSSLDDLNEFCKKQLNAKFIVFILPNNCQYSRRESPNENPREDPAPFGPYVLEPFRWVDMIRTHVDYPIHSLLPYFQSDALYPTCFDDDSHWNARGARIGAEAIYELCLADGCFN
jgi:hypothetical protein